jgi:hypothetical protein
VLVNQYPRVEKKAPLTEWERGRRPFLLTFGVCKDTGFASQDGVSERKALARRPGAGDLDEKPLYIA